MSAFLAASRSSAAMAVRAMAHKQYSLTNTSFQLARLYSSGKFPAHTVINMPALSPTMTQGNLGSWSKKVGDELSPGEAIAEIETDKASMDFEFQEEGFLAKILVDSGAKDIPVGQPIAVYVEEASDVAAFENFTAADAGEAAPAAPVAEEAPKEESKPAPTPAAAAAPTPSASSTVSAPTTRIFASPLAKTIALDKGIALKNIKGTGPNGRIIAKDVENYKAPAPAAAAPSATPVAAPAGASYEDIPITSMRKTIATRLLQSTQQSPTYIIQSQISVSKLLKLRASLNSSAEDRYRLSVNDLLIKAIALASVRVPAVNSAWLGEEGIIRQYKNVDVSVAVATPTGLITPIVKDAHAKGLSQISHEIKELGKRAKIGKLNPEEFIGGTICISNLGMNNAVTAFTSIINPPQSAIVAIGTVDKKAVPSNVNEQGFVFEDVITITGTFDHRTVDGAVGGEWIKELKRIIENPLEMLI
ncbi:dihydrolipoamide acetyltransferase component [Scheffersomyces coipomensis]|uniref:dihydrolipoamide acetyltransferase component n=1 Tax=Scheffersomyces coipomensis TaxID=1788519 RepID=UPI00315D1F14